MQFKTTVKSRSIQHAKALSMWSVTKYIVHTAGHLQTEAEDAVRLLKWESMSFEQDTQWHPCRNVWFSPNKQLAND